MSKFFNIFFALGTVALFGCATIEKEWEKTLKEVQSSFNNERPEAEIDGGKIEYVMTFHRMPTSSQKDLILKGVPDAGSREVVWVHGPPYCQSRDIEQIGVTESPTKKGFKRLHLKLSPQGMRRWSQMTAVCLGEPVAIIVDGDFQKSFVPTVVTEASGDNNIIHIDVDFPPKLSRNLWKHARRNYKHFNPSVFKLF